MRSSGYTLLEIIMVVAIIAVLAAVISLPFGKFRQTQALQNTTNAVVSALNDARTKTLAALDNASYGVHIESNQAVLFKGTTYSSTDPYNQSIGFESPVTLSSLSLNGGGSEIIFARLKGTTDQYGTIVLTLPNNQTKTVTVSAAGSVMRN